MSEVAEYVPPEQRLAIGVAFGDAKSSLGLALRVPKSGGVAHRAALNFAEDAAKEGEWADVRIVTDLSIPARSEVAAIKSGKGFPLGGDPLMLGVSVSHPKSPAGSLGGFVKFANGDEGIISACHVLANSGRGVDLSSADMRTSNDLSSGQRRRRRTIDPGSELAAFKILLNSINFVGRSRCGGSHPPSEPHPYRQRDSAH